MKALRGRAYRNAKLEFNRASYRKLFQEGPRQSHLIKFADRVVNLQDLNGPGSGESFRQFQLADTQNLIAESLDIAGVEKVRAVYEMVRDGLV